MLRKKVNRVLKKTTAIALAGTMAAGMLTGCQSGGNDVEAEKKEPEEVKEFSMSMLDAEELKTLQEAIDADFAYDLIYKCSKVGNDGNELGFRNAGSTGEVKARDIILEEMKKIGLKDVEAEKFPVDTWEFTSADITTADGTKIVLSAEGGSVGLNNELTAEIVDMGDGTKANYEGVDVEGKIVLIEFDNMLGYWYSAPQYEAELHGAAAIVCATNSESNNASEEGMLTFDGCLRTTIPVLSISRKDAAYLRTQIEEGNSTVKLNADMTVKDGESANVIGYIEGKDPSHIISVGAHYDGWYHSFQDDLYGVGMELALAKAMIETGYQPEYTLAFIAFGSEEYGVADTVFDDWCTGVWAHVTKNHPEWYGKSLAHFEIDSVRPDLDTFCLNNTPEMNSFFEKYTEELDESRLPEQVTNGVELAGWAGPWSQDYSFTRTGIPGICSRQGGTEWKVTNYHTQFDDESAWNEELFQFLADEYMQWLYTFNHIAIVPLNFSYITDMISEGMDLSAVEGTDIAENFAEAVEKLGTVSDEYYKSVQKVNMLYAQILAEKSEEDLTELKAELDKELKVIVSVYKMIEDDFMGLDPWQTIAFRDQLAAGNYAGLQDTLDALKANDGAAALDALMGVDTTYLTCFSKEVYEYVGITGINESKQWAVGKTLPMLNTYDAYQAIQAKVDAGAKDFTDEIAMIEKLMEEEMKILKDVLTSGTEQLNIAAEKLEKSEITNVITMEEEILEK